MQKFNLHTHTARCGHADGLDIQYIQSAIDAGIKVLGFSEHIPYVSMRLANCRMFYEQKDEYLLTMKQLKETYKNQIDIKVGYEVEYTEEHLDYLIQMRKECDYMILGQHCKYLGYEYDCFCNDEDVLAYTKQVEDAMKSKLITYVAHPDYIMLGRREFNGTCQESAHRIAKASLENDIPLEVNLNGFHYGKKQYKMNGTMCECYAYPFRDFWEIISSYGCKVVYGYDAHTPLAFMEEDRINKAKEILRDLNLNFIEDIELK